MYIQATRAWDEKDIDFAIFGEWDGGNVKAFQFKLSLFHNAVNDTRFSASLSTEEFANKNAVPLKTSKMKQTGC
jgi:hypothetical protein